MPEAPETAAPSTPDRVKMHLYCHGLGDCMLIGLPKTGGDTFWMLVDCGIHTSAKGGTAAIRKVVKDIAKVTGKRLDVVIGTHEHWDHISGFTQAADLFADFTVGEVWFSWAEDPEDEQARDLDKFKGEAEQALTAAAVAVAEADPPEDDPRFAMISDGLDALMGFSFGLKGERSRGAREALRGLSDRVRHFEPGTLAPLPQDVPGYRIYVLAPPRDPKLLRIRDRLSETYALGGAASPHAAVLGNALAIGEGTLDVDDDPASPFARDAGKPLSELMKGASSADDPNIVFLANHYAGDAVFDTKIEDDSDGPGPWGGACTLETCDCEYCQAAKDNRTWLQDAPQADQNWRRIDYDWLGAASGLALQLDSKTNNTSFVFALEIAATGRTLIFAADAQVGNWKSWAGVTFPAKKDEDPVTGKDLLGRAVFYKVGHHASRNATLREGGLELMTDRDLSAFIPTDEAMAKKVRWHDIPADGLLEHLAKKTSGRVIQSDHAWIHDADLDIAVRETGSVKTIRRGDGPAPCVVVEIG